MPAGAGAMDLTGDRELQRTLAALGPKIMQKVTVAAMRKAAQPIARAARANARRILSKRSEAALIRVYERGAAKRAKRAARAEGRGRKAPREQTRKQRIKTGQLARSIGWRVKKYTSAGVVFVAVGPKWPQGAHGHLVEYGHKASGWYAKQAGAKFIRARPFMRPAWHGNRMAALGIVTREHRARVENEARKAAIIKRA